MDRLTEYLFPKQVSTFAQDIDNLFYFIFYSSIALLAIVTFGMIYLAIKYRFKKNDEVRLTSSIDHNSILESSFVIIPLILVSITFVWGIKSYLNMVTVPNDAIEMKITGQSWYWTWDYPDGGPSNVFSTAEPLVLPVNTPIKIVLSSTDVLHSFYIPVMRAKMDVLPNRYNVMWFDAEKVGEYSIFCTEYCGTQHSQMSGTVKIVPIKVYEKWLTEAGSEDDDLPLDELGAKLYTNKACITCHTLDLSLIHI